MTMHDGTTRLVLVPTMLRLLSERGLVGSVEASGIRTIICAGSKLDAQTLEAARRWAPNATNFEYYGVQILDDLGRRMPESTLGNISVKSPAVCQGYHSPFHRPRCRDCRRSWHARSPARPACGGRSRALLWGLTPTTLNSALGALLSKDKRPLHYYLFSEIPLTDRGKVDRKMLQEWISNNDPRPFGEQHRS